MQAFDLLSASDPSDVFPVVPFGSAQPVTSIRCEIASAAHGTPQNVWRLVINAFFCSVALFTLMPSQAADLSGVLECPGFVTFPPVFTPDSRWLFGVGYKKLNRLEVEGTLYGWDVESEKLVTNLTPHGMWLTDVAVSPDNRWLVAFSGTDNIGSIWSIQSKAVGKTGPLTLTETFRHYTFPANVRPTGSIAGQIALAPSSREFASVSGKQNKARREFEASIKVWPMPDADSPSKTTPRSTAINNGKATSSSLLGSPQLASAATAESDSDAESGYQPRLKIPVDNYPIDMTYSPDGKFLVAGFWTGPPSASQRNQAEVHFFDSETGELKKTWKLNSQFKTIFYGYRGSLVYSPDGRHLLICFAGEEKAEVWDVESERPIWSGRSRLGFRKGAFSPDGKLLALSAKDYEVQLLRFPQCEVISVGVTPQNGTVLAFSPDGKLLATHWKSDSFKLWNVDELLTQKRWWLDTKPTRKNAKITQPK